MPICTCYPRVGCLLDPDLCCSCVGRSSPASRRAGTPDPALSSLKERAGVKRGLACSFGVVRGLRGHGGMASRLLSLIAAIPCEPAVRVKDRALGLAALARRRRRP